MPRNKLHIAILFVISASILFSTAIIEIDDVLMLNSSKKLNKDCLDENRTFWAYNYINNEYYQVNARLLVTGNYCYIYMDEQCIEQLGGEESIKAKTENICNEFDNTIYPRTIDLAGHPNGTLGDIDGDPRIFILFLDNHNYYFEGNEIEYTYSNLCEMVYINYGFYRSPYGFWLYPTIAHEFHHLIWFNNEWDEPPFTLEALAQYATYHAGYLDSLNNLVPQVASYLPHPGNSPLYWSDDQDYGSTYLFAFYIAEKYGVQILRDLITEDSDGPSGIETVLHKAGYNISFNELFINWITALTIDTLGFQNDLYGFAGLDVRISSYEVVNNLPIINKTVSINHYAFHIHKLVLPPDNFTVTVNKPPEMALGIAIAVHDSSGWHVQQYLNYRADSTVTETVSASAINEAYVIISHISWNTPVAPEERGSAGPSIEIKVTVTEGARETEELPSMPSSSQNTELTTAAVTSTGISPRSALVILIVSFLVLTRIRRIFNP
ncbi:MAG: hypothetical protein ACFFD4_31165 [Candidatus Odinarchaeota archaeon]